METVGAMLDEELEASGGILRLQPEFVGRFYPGLGRLGLTDDRDPSRPGYYFPARWIASTVEARNPVPKELEGLSKIQWTAGGVSLDSPVTLKEALQARPERLLGADYARNHVNDFPAFTKLIDVGQTIPVHFHPNKAEAYYFLEASGGPFDWSAIGFHPGVTREDVLRAIRRHDDSVLDLMKAYRLNVGEGFFMPPSVAHSAGTRLVLEIQQPFEVTHFLQLRSGPAARQASGALPRALRDAELARQRRTRLGGSPASRASTEAQLDPQAMLQGLPDEEAVLDLMDWEKSLDPYIYRNLHQVPVRDKDCHETERWIYHPGVTSLFSGKEVVLKPGDGYESLEKGPYALFVWRGLGTFGESVELVGGDHGRDELFVGADAATKPHFLANAGSDNLVLYKLFPADVNP